MAQLSFGLGYLYFTKGGSLKERPDEEVYLKTSKIYFEAALKGFHDVNHLVGVGQSHRYLSMIC